VTDFDHLARSALLSRRRLLTWLGGLGLAALLPGCARESTAGGTSGGKTMADCVLSPELTEGPYYLDLDLVRRDVREGRPGLPLDLRVKVADADACEPIADAAVDIWHCDAGGEYSGVDGDDGTFLRGVQVTDADGSAEFRTIYPGWYTGRAVHVHVKVHVGSSETYTGQLFFDEGVTETVYQTQPYSARPGPDTANTADSIYAQGGDSTVVAVTAGAERYRGVVTLGVRRAS
jgi:protocatechuate 3,4-dioxygenase beta subunit